MSIATELFFKRNLQHWPKNEIPSQSVLFLPVLRSANATEIHMKLTKVAFAQHLGVDRAQPTRWAARGMPVLDDGRVDVDAAEGWVAQNIDSTQRRRRSVGVRHPAAKAPPPAPFPCLEHLEHDSECGAVLASMLLAHRLPAETAALALHAGASIEVAKELLVVYRLAIMQTVTEVLDLMGCAAPPDATTWSESSVWQSERFDEVDWAAVNAAVAKHGLRSWRTGVAGHGHVAGSGQSADPA